MKQVTSTPLRRLAGAFLVMLASCAPLLAETGEPARLARIEASFWGDHRVELHLPEPVAWRAFVVDGPPRLVVDVEAEGLEADPSLLSGAIVGASAGRIASGWSRLVLTMERTFAVRKAGLDEGVLAISLERIGQGGFEKAARLAPGREALVGPPEGAAPPEAGKLRIVLDPGHGGVDPGASRGGVREKDIALSFGLEFAAMLENTGRYDVALTRRDDRFLLLDDRVAFARAAEAALFLSLHANTVTEGEANGAAIYVTSRIASDPASARVALLENRSDQVAGLPGNAEQDDVTLTLFDMARPATEARARMAAERVVAALGETTGVIRSRPLRAADFRVLRAPDMPSLLLELGFLSDPGDLADMQSPEWRADVGRALIRALDEWREADEDFLALMRQ